VWLSVQRYAGLARSTSSSANATEPAEPFTSGSLRVEHLAGPDHAELLGHRRGRRDALHEDAQLVRGPVAQRLELAHHAVAAVDRVPELVPVAPKRSRTLSRAQPITWSTCAIVYGIADADHPDVTLADLAGTFELDPELARALEPSRR
jgi:hypothetical protein